MKTLILIMIMVSAMKGDIFRDSQKYKGSTTAKVVDVIDAIFDGNAKTVLPGYNGAGDEFKADLRFVYKFYYGASKKGKDTPLDDTINYNQKSEYREIIRQYQHDSIASTGHSTAIA